MLLNFLIDNITNLVCYAHFHFLNVKKKKKSSIRLKSLFKNNFSIHRSRISTRTFPLLLLSNFFSLRVSIIFISSNRFATSYICQSCEAIAREHFSAIFSRFFLFSANRSVLKQYNIEFRRLRDFISQVSHIGVVVEHDLFGAAAHGSGNQGQSVIGTVSLSLMTRMDSMQIKTDVRLH